MRYQFVIFAVSQVFWEELFDVEERERELKICREEGEKGSIYSFSRLEGIIVVSLLL